MTTSPKILLLGAGAVGQTYAYYLDKAGAEISFMVRPKYIEETQRGFDLYELGITHSPRGPLRLIPEHVLTTDEEVASHDWDQVWLCVPSTSLQGDWFGPFAEAIKDATLVKFSTNPLDHDFIEEHLPSSQVVDGMIGYIAYQGPLEDEKVAGPGMHIWLPPGSPSNFDGEDPARLEQVVGLLKKGGCNAKRSAGIKHKSAYPSAVLMPFLVSLELAGWSFQDLKKGDGLDLAGEATREAAAAIAHSLGEQPPRSLGLHRPWLLKALLGVAPCVTPLPLETYLAYHFTKVGAQTRRNIHTYIQMCEGASLPCPSLQTLHARHEEMDAQKS